MRHLNASVAAEPFLNGTSSNYVEEMYFSWLENPRSVHKVSACVFCKRGFLLLGESKHRLLLES